MPIRSSHRRSRRVALAPAALAVGACSLALVTTTPSAAAAQAAVPAPTPRAAQAFDGATAPTPRAIGPTLDGARAGVTRPATTADRPAADVAPVSGPRAGRPVALMVVGAAALVLGAIIGGDGGHAVAIGGAVVGLIGLYQFVR